MTFFRTTRVSLAATLSMACLSLAGCTEPAHETSGKAAETPQASASGAALPVPTHEINGRMVTVRLPYRTKDNHLWVDADPNISTGPFTFQGLDIEPRGGPDGTDLAVFTYKADGPGSATLRFALTPVGKGSPQDLIRQGQVAAWYEPTLTVN